MRIDSTREKLREEDGPLADKEGGEAGGRSSGPDDEARDTRPDEDAMLDASVPPATMMVGRRTATLANSNRQQWTEIVALEKVWVFLVSPPTRKAVPITSKRLLITEPRSESWTTRKRPPRRAKMDTISSVAFPNVAFRRPPIESFVYSASSSVTKPSRSARGQRAIIAREQVHPSDHPTILEIAARGIVMRRMLSLEPKKKALLSCHA